MPRPLSELIRGKFQQDVLWNVASLAVLGVSGIALNVLIGEHYDSATLGVFNQALAAYIFFSQIAVGGINLSVLRSVAEHQGDRPKITSIVIGSLVPTLVLAAVTTLAFYFARHPIAYFLESEDVATGIAAATPGLFFFALNKVLLAVVNGVQRMRAYAIYQALRYALILAGLFLALAIELDGSKLAFVFTFAEGILFVVLAIEVIRQLAFPFDASWKDWTSVHLSYGVRSVLSGVMLELNARVDVLMIGYFMTDADVGVYTFAAMIAEGVYQLLVVLQNVYNPILARQIAQRAFGELHAMVVKGRLYTYVVMLVVGVVAVRLYPTVLGILVDKPEFFESAMPFTFLMAGIVLASGYIPFAQTLLMGGHPGWHTGLMAITVLTNVIGNSILIPIYGLNGAAIATAIATVASVFVLKVFVKSRLGFRL
jgi:O-antigen/teichoic acid export membrane protein